MPVWEKLADIGEGMIGVFMLTQGIYVNRGGVGVVVFGYRWTLVAPHKDLKMSMGGECRAG